MGSSRRPGKSLADVSGRSLLARCLDGLAAAGEGSPHWELCVATTTADADLPLAREAAALGALVFRGPEDDVLARYLQAIGDLEDRDLVLRATADNPLYCPRRVRRIVGEHWARGADYTCLEGLSYVVPEVMTAGALRRMARLDGVDAYCREHVTPRFRRPGHGLHVHQLDCRWQDHRPECRLTIDTDEELARLRALFAALERPGERITLEAAYAWWDAQGGGLAAPSVEVAFQDPADALDRAAIDAPTASLDLRR